MLDAEAYIPRMAADTVLTIDDINHWLKANDRTQAWLARQAGVEESRLWRILRGERPLTEEVQRKLLATIEKWNRADA